MDISVHSVYDYKTLLRYSMFLVRQKIGSWIVIAVCDLIAISACIFSQIKYGGSETILLCMILCLFMTALVLYMNFVLPRFSIKKAKTIGAVVGFCFGQEGFSVKASGNGVDEAATVTYENIISVRESNNVIYLFISKRHAYIVDENGIENSTSEALKELLRSRIDAKKIRFQAKTDKE